MIQLVVNNTRQDQPAPWALLKISQLPSRNTSSNKPTQAVFKDELETARAFLYRYQYVTLSPEGEARRQYYIELIFKSQQPIGDYQ